MHEMTAIEIPDPDTHLARALDARGWARDLALVGASTSMVVPALVGAGITLAIVSGVVGTLLGIALGSVVPALLDRRVRRIPLAVLALAGAGLGANWGAATAVIAASTLGSSWIWYAELGATAGLVQLGWFWLPAIWLRARGRSTLPLVAGSVLLAPVIAALAAQIVP